MIYFDKPVVFCKQITFLPSRIEQELGTEIRPIPRVSFFLNIAIQHDDLKRLLKWVCLWIPFDNNNQKHFPETLNWTECIYYIGEGMHHNLHVMQDIDKALYVAEFHQEEEQEEC